MSSKQELIRALTALDGFSSPDPSLEQYPTPPDLAGTLLHRATLDGDITDQTVVDLGTGTGILAIGAALYTANRVIGIDIDPDALATAADNKASISKGLPIEWVCGDITKLPLAVDDTTVLMNPPFGAQHAARHADRRFLEAARTIGCVSYSIHNEDSQAFITAYTNDHGGTITHAYEAELSLDHQFAFHTNPTKPLDVEIYRIVWEPISDTLKR